MRHPTLFDVPKDSLSRRDRLMAFREAHRIWTHFCRGEDPWLAMLLPRAEELAKQYGSANFHPVEMMADYCRLLEEQDIIAVGHTERDAVRTLCAVNKIGCDL